MRYFIPCALLVTTAIFVGCSQDQSTATTKGSVAKETVGAVNKYCPVMGSEVTDDGGRVQWNGRTVGFCCPECIEAFEAMSDEEKSEALASADKDHDGHDHGEHDHDDHGEESSDAS